ncbi:thiol:disulfide interchange protein [Thalassotalea sp. 42_200_T64]|nr:thiol:disulfide interchange protein [Thalassotalea sp. 42_200_T64]
MLKKLIIIVAATMMLIAVPAASDEDNTVKIKANLAKLGLQVETVQASKMDNLFEAITDQGLFYTSADGSFLIQGKVYQITDDGINNLTEESLAKVRVDGMKTFSDSMIVFPAKDEKYQMTVFTDLTCGYCRKLHNQIDEFNDLGITVRYLAFPRGGLSSQSYTDIRSVWCSDDQQSAMTQAKGGAHVAQKVCALPVAEQYNFGRKIGVSGTPAIILNDGNMVPGYKTPDQMQQILQSYSVNKAG